MLGMNGNGMRRIDRERRQHREHPLHEPRVEPLRVGRRTVPPARTPRCRPRAAGRAVRATPAAARRAAIRRARGSRPAAAPASGRRRSARSAGSAPARSGRRRGPSRTRPGWARDRDEAQALQQRMARVLRLLHHAWLKSSQDSSRLMNRSRTVGCYFERRSRAGGRSERVHCRPLLGCLPGLFTGTVTPLHDGVMAIH